MVFMLIADYKPETAELQRGRVLIPLLIINHAESHKKWKVRQGKLRQIKKKNFIKSGDYAIIHGNLVS